MHSRWGRGPLEGKMMPPVQPLVHLGQLEAPHFKFFPCSHTPDPANLLIINKSFLGCSGSVGVGEGVQGRRAGGCLRSLGLFSVYSELLHAPWLSCQISRCPDSTPSSPVERLPSINLWSAFKRSNAEEAAFLLV